MSDWRSSGEPGVSPEVAWQVVLAHSSALEAERDACRAALAELVRLKDHPRHDDLADEKRAAWEAARSVLAGVVSIREKDDERPT